MADDILTSDTAWATNLAAMAANLPRVVELFGEIAKQYPYYAKQYRMFYLELTAEGFTPEQALEIVKAHGVMPR
jgi:hypothetical protein